MPENTMNHVTQTKWSEQIIIFKSYYKINIYRNKKTHFVEHDLDFGANWKDKRIKF